ncbi:LOW QUALITY PROTEIN: hypothetical protein U9M48_002423 [Paspalum notatum var. saurae]|uniref:Uncharacterized protein n=1 Tax=Paspalum notatum var. saurae TaxID=547442 RepID=A0AAQ3PJS8_PASNO
MEAVTGAMSTLLPKLADLITKEYNLQKSVRAEITFLNTELEYMQAALRKLYEAPIDQPPDPLDKLWARNVRELSYDLEDSIDAFMVHIENHAPSKANTNSFKAFLDRSMNLLRRGKIRHNISIDIEEYKRRIKEVREQRDRYKVDTIATKPLRPSVDSLRQRAIYEDAKKLIGIEEKSNDIIKILMEEEEDMPSNRKQKIVSIVGVGGLGKTTLANTVYSKVKGKYAHRAFVTVSNTPVMDKIFKDILHQLDGAKYSNIKVENWDEKQLIGELRDLLSDKRYIIVIDDIWNKLAWTNIQYALINNELGSRIIITTRIHDVAKQASYVYDLKPLSPVDSRKLFFLTIFSIEECYLPKELDEESKNILRKCGGVPLAIITIGSMLASKSERENTREYWSKVYKSMGCGLQNSSNDSLYDMRSILSVSYYDLLPHLMTCLLYLSLYPEDYMITTEDLILKWIGEGFVPERNRKDMFEVGKDYVHELANRSLIQLSHTGDDSLKTINFVRIHDMVLDLIIFLSKEEHFLTKLGAKEPDESVQNKIRRLSAQTSNEENERKLGKEKCSHVRSLIVFKGAFNLLPELSSFPFLRVLDITAVELDNHQWRDICNLLYLSYLALHLESITDIPEDIGKAKTLADIKGTEVVKWPSSVVPLQLVYFRFGGRLIIPDWFGDLKSLQELIGVVDVKSPATLDVLGELNKLRQITLFFNEWNEGYEQPFLSCLSRLLRLKTLIICGKHDNNDLASRCDKLSPGPQQLHAMRTICAICSVPKWMSSLCSLTVLRISLQTLGEEGLQILGRLPFLSHLTITMWPSWIPRDEELLVIDNVYPFLSLTKFKIYNREVMFAQGAMQKLRTLKFFVRETMDQFGNSGFGLENLSSLEDIFVSIILSHANHKELDTAENAIKKAVDMNPNKPKLKIYMVTSLSI